MTKDAGSFLKVLFFCLIFALAAKTYGQIAKTGAVSDKSQEAVNKVIVWAVPAEQKVRPNDRVKVGANQQCQKQKT